jgi:hypothetical protein
MSDKKSLLESLSELGEQHEESRLRYEAENDAWWDSLSEEEREDAFYAVVKRIHKAEIIDRGTYRYALYDVFGFDAGMYGLGMDCGYMTLHNSIYSPEEIRDLRDRELAAHGIIPKKHTFIIEDK